MGHGRRNASIHADGRNYVSPHSLANATPILPFLVKVSVVHNSGWAPGTTPQPTWTEQTEEAYCIWFFGLVMEVPFTSQRDQPRTISFGQRSP